MKQSLLPAQGTWHKANLHAHTTLSDGHLTAAQIKQEYRARGYSVVAFTDHRHYAWHRALADDAFVPLAAFEADLNEPIPAGHDFQRIKTYHLNLYDTRPETRGAFTAVQPPQRYGDIEALNAYIAQMNEAGFLVCYNHPRWSLQTHADYTALRGVFAMEIYNHGCEHDGLYGYEPQAYDEMLRAGIRLACVATDDNHNCYAPGHPLCDSFGGVTMLRLPELSYASVITALQAGDFYATTGPEIYALYVEDAMLHVACSPVAKIYVATRGRRCKQAVAPNGGQITRASFPLVGDEGYVRVDCEDARRRHAYTRAYFPGEWGACE